MKTETDLASKNVAKKEKTRLIKTFEILLRP